MQVLITTMQVPTTQRANRLSVFVYHDPAADFPFAVYAGVDKNHAPRLDAFVQLSDALRFAAKRIEQQLDAYTY